MTSIVGTWRLVRAEAFDSSGNPQPAPYGGTPVGRVMRVAVIDGGYTRH